MALNEEEVINEPKLEASNCSIITESADEIKLHYKLKYPGFYSIPTEKILDLLDNNVLFSHLENSVKSFIYHAREIHKIEKMRSSITPNYRETEIDEASKSNENFGSPVLGKVEKKEANEYEISDSSPDLSVYDSVHSIKIPDHSYESEVKSSRHSFFHRKKLDNRDHQS